MSKTIYNFRTLSDTKLDTEAENVYTKLTDNADFPSPTPELTVLETHLSEYREALAEAALGDREKVILKNRKRGQLEHTLRSLALYVEHAADGDEALILTAGFSLRKTTQGGSDTPFVTNFRVKYGDAGSGIAKVGVKFLRSAWAYRFDYRLVESEEWNTLYSSSSQLTITGLQSLQYYEFRAAYVGRRGVNAPLHFSETLTTIIL